MIRKLSSAGSFLRGYIASLDKGPETKKKLYEHQMKKFEVYKSNVLSKSKYYRDYMDKPFNVFPIMNKKIYMEKFDQINTQQILKEEALSIAIDSEKNRDFSRKYNNLSVGLSSGTSGNRGIFIVSDNERAEWAGYIIGKMLPLELKKHRVALFLRANNNLYETINGILINFQYFDLLESLDEHIEEILKFCPTIIVAPAQVLKEIASINVLRELSCVERMISVAEVLEIDDRKYIESAMGLHVEEIYQATEGLIAYTCKHGNLHLNEKTLIIEREWIDKNNGRFVPIITDLRRSTQPIVRYRLDDILIENSEVCKCGSNYTVLKRIEGRCDDVLEMPDLKGIKKTIYPDFVRNTIISSHPYVDDYSVIQTSENKLSIYLKPLNESISESIALELNKLWERMDVIQPKYEFYELKGDFMKKKRRVYKLTDV